VIATTGASGKLGGKIAQRLATAGAEQLLVGRDLARLPDLPAAARRGPAEYGDSVAMRAALAGADTLLLVSANLSGRRLEEHSAAIAAGAQRVGAVARDDIADVAAAVLLDDAAPSRHDARVYEVTGPEAVTLDQAAAELTRAVGRTYSYQDETAAQSRAWRHDLGDTAIEIQNRVSWFLAIAAGEAAAVTDVVADLAGHRARSIEANPDVREPR
jgi:NAD(P)H dehydrogenase (quinone)